MRFNHVQLTPEERTAFEKLRRWVIGVWSAIAIAAIAAAFAAASDGPGTGASQTASVAPAGALSPATSTPPLAPVKAR